jgi:membrane-associated phospholipid phosphatase
MSTADTTLWLGLALTALWLVAARRAVLRHHVRGTALTVVITTGIAAGSFTGYAAVVDAVADQTRLARADEPTLQWMIDHRSPSLTPIMLDITTAGSTLGMTVLAAIGTAVLLAWRRVWAAVIVAVAGLGAAALVNFFKNLYDRQRPPLETRLTYEPTYSLPSGHSLSSLVVVGILAVILIAALHAPLGRAVVIAVAGLVVLAIGTSRLYLGVHWLTDVVAGWLLGATWLAVCCTALALLATRRARDVAPLPPDDQVQDAPE